MSHLLRRVHLKVLIEHHQEALLCAVAPQCILQINLRFGAVKIYRALICSLQVRFIHRGGPLRYFNTNRCITFQWPDPQHIEGATLECMHRHTMTLLTRRVLVCPPRKEDLIFYSDFLNTWVIK